MKVFCLFCLTFLTSPLISENIQDITPEKKIRVASKDIWIDDQGIFVALHGEWTPVSMISSDAQGVYVRLFSSEDDIGIVWSCGNCGRWNWGGAKQCRHCGKSRN